MQARDDLLKFVRDVKGSVEGLLNAEYPPDSESEPYESTHDAMRHALFCGGGGKRVRPAVSIAACIACGGIADSALPFAVAVEELHTYTLIVDDIQDGDETRRGEPACHRKFGDDTALLAAMRLLEHGAAPFHRMEEYSTIVRHLFDQLHRGQCADLNSRSLSKKWRNQAAVDFIAAGKTAAVFQLALLSGGVAAGATSERVKALVDFGYDFGLAYQAADDLLDIVDLPSTELRSRESAETRLRSIQFYDLFTDPSEARQAARRIAGRGIAKLDRKFGFEANLLRSLMDLAVERVN